MSTALSVAPVEGVDQHFVQFYEDEPFICAAVADFLEVGVNANRAVVVLATAAHRQMFSRALATRGHDVAGLIAEHRLVMHDARELLDRFVRGGAPDEALFFEETRIFFSQILAAGAFSRLHVYTEMADLLWEEGCGPAAMRLEELANELNGRHPLTVLCGYRLRRFDCEEDRDAFEHTCAVHARVCPAESYRRDADRDSRLRQVARLQQRAQALENEVARRELLESELRRKNDELARAVHFSDLFVELLGHDLRDPLSGVATAARLLARRSDSETVVGPAARILNSAERMGRMLDQLLDFARIRMGQGIGLERTTVDLAEICRLSIDELGAPPAGVSLSTEGDLLGQWDASRLAQLTCILIGNALAHGTGTSPVGVCLDGLGAAVELEVSNAGAVAPDVLPVLFEAPRVSGGGLAAQGRSSGLGLGLYIAREIVLAHAGRIDVASSAAAGTRVTVSLPRHHVAEPARRAWR
jgi:signal transduction histidine kinase